MTVTVDSDAEHAAEMNRYFRADRDAIAWPYPLFERWQAGDGIVRWEGGPATILTRFDHVRDVMNGVYPIANDGYRHGALADATLSRLPEAQHDTFRRVLDFETLFMSRHNGERHLRLRRIASRAFTARRIEVLRESIQDHVDDLIDGMLTSASPDFKRDVADRLPVRVIADLIGVPSSDRGLIWHWAEAIAAHLTLTPDTLTAVDVAMTDFREYVRKLIDGVRQTGEGPELAKLMLDHRDNDAMTEDELIAMYLLILFGGSETTTNLLGNGFLALQRNRDQWDRLVDDPSLIRGAVDELLRYDAPLQSLPRTVIEDCQIGDRSLKARESIVIVMAAADRDPRHFENPDVLDVTRANKGDNLAFAVGPHFCLGAALARMEAEIAFSTLVNRFPDARWIESDLSYRGSAALRAIESLPIDVGRDRGRAAGRQAQ